MPCRLSARNIAQATEHLQAEQEPPGSTRPELLVRAGVRGVALPLAPTTSAASDVRAPVPLHVRMGTVEELTQAGMKRQTTLISLASQWELNRVLHSKGLTNAKHRPAPRLAPRSKSSPWLPESVRQRQQDAFRVPPKENDASQRQQMLAPYESRDADASLPRALLLAQKRGIMLGHPSVQASRPRRRTAWPTTAERSMSRAIHRRMTEIQGPATPIHERVALTPGYANLSLAKQERLQVLLRETAMRMTLASET